jgi:hypothetical protein
MEFTRTELNFLVEFARAEILSLHDLSEKFTRAPTTIELKIIIFGLLLDFLPPKRPYIAL